jgi:hypothetical protein
MFAATRRLQNEAVQKLRQSRSFIQETLNKEVTDDMKRTILTIACALVAPLAFAQTGATTTEQTTRQIRTQPQLKKPQQPRGR